MRENYQKNIENRLIIPTMQFLHREKSSGIVLAVFVILALILANSPLREEYSHLLECHLGFIVNGNSYLDFSVEHWINDGLMSMFFFVVGLELKREFIGGELRDLRKVTLPIMAAIFGMLFPAAIYMIFNFGTPTANGWGIPMATDIAFALAVVYMLGDRVPISAKVFLTTLAIVDDLGAVVVIALFYTSEISVVNIAIGMLFLGGMFVGNRLGVKNVLFYGILGIGGVWLAFLMSGIHATISAVLAAMVIPADSRIPEAVFIARMKKLTMQFKQALPNDVRTLEPEQLEILSKVKTESVHAIPPLQRLEHSLHPLVSFVIMPIFALTNAGVSFVDMDVSVLFANNVALGVMCGLLLGKPLGILFAVWLTEKTGLGRRSRAMTWRTMTGVGFITSIGFTMSMFVTMLVFNSPENYVQAKIGIFTASIFGGIIGYRLLNKKSSTN
ncbi:Na+/H+ antiporter NhaA [Prevotella sp. OH937_COT-195]|uniref:Na+/H+ antiporter NhaA n=1 Tax=Prevotella sp. OH937_COT-195 TaxID=2491051 RepID=UPI000F65471A|nr:Na+/H+ antiporter NhaA [Prevotella sp. OH937_COT-195]RRD02745.1 Na+/H+ antiporter NhaA [Prevotella sp. OH937_COT-195]